MISSALLVRHYHKILLNAIKHRLIKNATNCLTKPFVACRLTYQNVRNIFGVVEAAGSNPVTQTKAKPLEQMLERFSVFIEPFQER